ncbi:MAG: Mut7-C RNAse domain-containing protein [Candidatus Eisenbacteria bacterium]
MLPARFVTDSSLDFVARRLRFLGYDVSTFKGARLEELFEAAAREGRIVLSLSDRHPRRFGAVPMMSLRRDDPAAAVRAIAAHHDPAGAPFSRCPSCNVGFHRRHPMEARGEIPGRVLRVIRSAHFCPQCGKWYWDGTHVARIREWLETALGRPLPVQQNETGS